MNPRVVSKEIALQDSEWQLERYDDEKKRKQVDACLALIDKYLTTKLVGRQSCCTSYGLKHIFERIAGIYISNGAAIKAMVLRGFTPYQCESLICRSKKNKAMHNYYFNLSKKEFIKMESITQNEKNRR